MPELRLHKCVKTDLEIFENIEPQMQLEITLCYDCPNAQLDLAPLAERILRLEANLLRRNGQQPLAPDRSRLRLRL